MKRLSQHIYRLLIQHNCVIVPELGGFVAQHISAHYDEAETTFLPPCRIVAFNAQLNANDGLLVQAYMTDEKVSFAEASDLLAQDVEHLRQQLDRAGYAYLYNIGRLSVALDGRYLFESEQVALTTPEFYGLEAFSMELLQWIPSDEATDTEEPEEQTDLEAVSTLDSRHYTIRINRELANYVAAAMVALVCYFAWVIPSSQTSSVHTAQMLTETLFTKPSLPSLTTPQAPESTEASDADVSRSDAPVATEQPADASEIVPQKYYTIVLASQVSLSNARSFVQQLQKKGFSEAQILSRRFNRVVFGTYSTESEAYNALRNLRQQSGAFSDGWVMQVAQ